MADQQEGQQTPAQRRQFVREHRTAIFGYGRQQDGPAMSAVYYVMDGDDILVFTMRERAKAKAIERNPKVSLCVLDENWPLTYVTVFCDAVIDATVDDDLDAVVDLGMQISGVMAGRALDASAREEVVRWCLSEDRVRVRLKPYASFMTPPRHVHSESDVVGITHWTSSTLPWNDTGSEG
jgi:pyridoxamine 5'-phosphate oxidase-like protein